MIEAGGIDVVAEASLLPALPDDYKPTGREWGDGRAVLDRFHIGVNQ